MAKSKSGSKKAAGAAPSRGSTYGTIHQATPMKLKLITIAIIITGLSVCFWEEFGHTRHEAHLTGVRSASPGKDYLRNAQGLWLHTSATKASSPKAAVFVVHGYGTHCGRLGALTNGLNKAGSSVYCIDLQGHGRSDGERGYAPHLENHVADIEQYIAHVRKADNLGNTPVVVVGQSLGGLVATRVAQGGRVDLAGVALVAPAVAVATKPLDVLLMPALPVISNLLPKFPLRELDRSHINQNAADHASFMADPLTYSGPVPVRIAAETLTTIDAATAAAPTMKVPFLMQVATDDTVTPTAGQLAFFARVGSPQKKLIEYGDAWHAVLADPNAKSLVPDLAKWISSL